MNTKSTLLLLSGISLCFSVVAYAVAERADSDYMNWSYVNGDQQTNIFEPKVDSHKEITCTEGCNKRSTPEEYEDLIVTYEGEASPLKVKEALNDVHESYRDPALFENNLKPISVYQQTPDILARQRPSMTSAMPIEEPVPTQNEIQMNQNSYPYPMAPMPWMMPAIPVMPVMMMPVAPYMPMTFNPYYNYPKHP